MWRAFTIGTRGRGEGNIFTFKNCTQLAGIGLFVIPSSFIMSFLDPTYQQHPPQLCPPRDHTNLASLQ